ncbi:MAG: thioredoxin [Gemmatimonas sp.]|nr:thioredoxin [Gemmatimonas sp.]
MIRIGILTKSIATTALALVLTSGALSAQEKEPFTPDRFAELQEQGALILVDIFADWCPTCAQQQEILAQYQEEHADVPLVILEVNFDDQKEYVTQFEAPRQSTLVLFHGEERLWFSVAETRPDVVFAELNKGAAAVADSGS